MKNQLFEACVTGWIPSEKYVKGFTVPLYNLPSKYIINDNVTVLIWEDGTKTIVKKSDEDSFDPKLAFLTAYFQHYSGLSKTKANKYLDSLKVSETKAKPHNGFKVGDKVEIVSNNGRIKHLFNYLPAVGTIVKTDAMSYFIIDDTTLGQWVSACDIRKI